MPFTLDDLTLTVQHFSKRLETVEPTLNSADAKLGDGDTGTMLARMSRSLSEVDLNSQPDLGSAFMALTKAAMTSTGSSLGTLIGTAFMSFAKATQGESEIEWREISRLLHDAVSAMKARGKSEIGDKTIMDSFNAIASAVESASNREEFVTKARDAAKQALDDMREKPSQIGRARMYGEQSIGLDDPGMLAIALILE